MHGIDQVPVAAWRELVAGNPILRLEVLKAITNNLNRPLSLQFFLLEDQRGIAAAALCQTLTRAAPRNSLDELLFGRAAVAARRLGFSSQPLPCCFTTPRCGTYR